MKLYHGSNVGIEEIDLSKSKTGKDFGCGFYLNPNKNQAEDLAEQKDRIMNSDIQFQIECLTAELAEMLMEEYGWDIPKALDELYNSLFYEKLNDPK